MGGPTIESTPRQAGNGGNGKKYSITGTEKYYAGGGGGGVRSYSTEFTTSVILGQGGLGGGGNGAGGYAGNNSTTLDENGYDAEHHTGGGGGGVGAITAENFKGGNGGSGIVIIRYRNIKNELLSFGLDNNKLFINIFEHSNLIDIEQQEWCHYSIEIDNSNFNYNIYKTHIPHESRLDLNYNIIVDNLIQNCNFINPYTSNFIKDEITTIIGDNYNLDINVDQEFSPHAIEDLRIYNKSLQSLVEDHDIIKLKTLYMSQYNVNVTNQINSTGDDIHLSFYNNEIDNNSIMKNIGKGNNNFDVLIKNPNKTIIPYIIDNTLTINNGLHGFQWNETSNLSYLEINQNNIKTEIFEKNGEITIKYKFKVLSEVDKSYPIIQFTDKVKNVIIPKFEIIHKYNLNSNDNVIISYYSNKLIIKEFEVEFDTKLLNNY